MKQIFKTTRYTLRVVYVYFRSLFASRAATKKLLRTYNGILTTPTLDNQMMYSSAVFRAAEALNQLEVEREMNGLKPLTYFENKRLVYEIMADSISYDLFTF